MKKYEEGGDVAESSLPIPEEGTGLQEETFGDAFKRARRNGEKTFEFKGKKYTTETADDKAKAKKAKAESNFASAETKGGAKLMTRKDRMGDKPMFKAGGSVSSASKRADGCATKGKTRGRMV